MSFVDFLVGFGKIAIGYGLGLIILMAGLFALSSGNTIGGGLFALLGLVLLLFGVYSERKL